GEAGVAGDTDDLVALDQLAGKRGLLRRVQLLRVEGVLDRAAADAAVVVDAVVVRLGDLADRGEVDARDQHVDSAELDRRSRGFLAVAETALHRGTGGGRSHLRVRAGRGADRDRCEQRNRQCDRQGNPAKLHPSSSSFIELWIPTSGGWTGHLAGRTGGMPRRQSSYRTRPYARHCSTYSKARVRRRRQ